LNNTIQIEGAKVHNLRNLDLEIPRENLLLLQVYLEAENPL